MYGWEMNVLRVVEGSLTASSGLETVPWLSLLVVVAQFPSEVLPVNMPGMVFERCF